MKTRVISSIIAILILFFFLFYLPEKFFYSFIFALVLVSLAELHNIIFRQINYYYYLSIVFSGIIFLTFVYIKKNIFFELFSILFILICVNLVFKFDSFKKEIINLSKFIFSIIYIPMISIFVLLIYNTGNGKLYLLHFLIICWATDSFAYLIGSKIGKHKLCKSISPNKTVEGFAGGVIGGIIAGILGLFFIEIKLFNIIILSLFTSLACVVGDLFESLIKRKFDVKDSGVIIPGHGGILDRIDGVLLAIPIYYFLIFINV